MKKLFFAASGAALLLLLVVAGVFLWSNRPRHGATALLKVSAVQPTIAFADLHLQDEDQRDIFQKTQLALLTSRFVLTPVLHDAEIVRLTSVRNAGEDPVDWLARALDVGFLDNTEILQVSLELANQDEARRLVDAVVKSYFENVVERERQTRRTAFDQLTEVSTDLSDELRQKRAKYQRRARAFGASESEYTEVDRQITNQNLTLLSDERARVKADLFRTELTLEELEVHRQALRTKETHPEERRETLGSHGDRAAGGGSNPMVDAVRVTEPLSGDEDADDVGSDRGSAGDLLGAAKASADGATKEKSVQDTAPDRRAGSEGTRPSSKTQQATPEANDPELQARVLDVREGLLQRRVTELNDEIQEVREALRRLAEVNVDLTIAASEIDQLEEIVVDLKLKLARWEIELTAPPRIQLIQSAQSGAIQPL